MEQQYTLKQFGPEQWKDLKRIRLEALQETPGFFGSNFEREVAYTDEDWIRKTTSPLSAFWGLYDGGTPVGLTGIIRDQHNLEEAWLIASYIKPQYRGKGLSTLFYEARIQWARENGCSCVIVSHRADNEASRAANQHFGFQFTHKESRLWPDGTEADNIFYRLDL